MRQEDFECIKFDEEINNKFVRLNSLQYAVFEENMGYNPFRKLNSTVDQHSAYSFMKQAKMQEEIINSAEY